jgi:hypothetical protein
MRRDSDGRGTHSGIFNIPSRGNQKEIHIEVQRRSHFSPLVAKAAKLTGDDGETARDDGPEGLWTRTCFA